MNLHLTAQYAILAFAAAKWALAGSVVVPAAPATSSPAEAIAAPVQEWTIAGDRILVTNLVGRVTVGPASGDRIVVRVRLQGKDSARLKVQVEEGGDAELHVVYPLDEHHRYVYPEMSAGSRTQIGEWRPKSRSSGLQTMLDAMSGRKVEVRGRAWGDALEAWADIEVLVPQGKPGTVRLGVGRIDAAGVRAALDLDTKSGSVAANDIAGDLLIDTGSGDVTARGVRGNVDIDTGSGSVDAEDLEGDGVIIDTGSGMVSARGVKARRVDIDTGSGSVDATRIETLRLVIDTGSGEVNASEVRTANAEIDTGSGSVELDLVGMGLGRYLVDTGSGGVRMTVPADVSARIRASTGSGGIEVDLPAARVFRMSRNNVSLEVGGGESEVIIDTGSGGIRISARR
ncbi:MAG: DUF4097 family beta strand repeat-containing protein [Gemmatimonadota bacterium]